MKTFAAFIAAMSLVSAVAAHATTDAGPATNGAWPAAAPPASAQNAGLTDAWLSPRRFRSSPPAGEHRVVFLHVARRIALEPGRRTRLRRCARTVRRADRDSRPARRRRSSRTPLQSPGSAARFRPIHRGSASGPRRLPSARRTVQEDLRLRESRSGPINKTHLTLRSALRRPAAGRPKAPPNPTTHKSAVEAPDSRGRIGNRSSESLSSGLRGRSSRRGCSETET